MLLDQYHPPAPVRSRRSLRVIRLSVHSACLVSPAHSLQAMILLDDQAM
jgi:hypothetical protein